MSNKTYFKYVMSNSYKPFVAELEPVNGYEIFEHSSGIVDSGAWKLLAIWNYDGKELKKSEEKVVYSIILAPNNIRSIFRLGEITFGVSSKMGEGMYAFDSIHSPSFNKYHEYFEVYCPLLAKNNIGMFF